VTVTSSSAVVRALALNKGKRFIATCALQSLSSGRTRYAGAGLGDQTWLTMSSDQAARRSVSPMAVDPAVRNPVCTSVLKQKVRTGSESRGDRTAREGSVM